MACCIAGAPLVIAEIPDYAVCGRCSGVSKCGHSSGHGIGKIGNRCGTRKVYVDTAVVRSAGGIDSKTNLLAASCCISVGSIELVGKIVIPEVPFYAVDGQVGSSITSNCKSVSRHY